MGKLRVITLADLPAKTEILPEQPLVPDEASTADWAGFVESGGHYAEAEAIPLNQSLLVEMTPEELAEFNAQAEEDERLADLKQGWHKLHNAVDSGVDEERGPFDVIPLSALRGGKAKPTKVFKKPMKHLVLDQSIPPRGWYKSKQEATDRIRPRPCYTEALLTTPYGGFCPVGCSFCYINNGSRGYKATGLPTVDPDYPEKFEKQLDKMMVSGAGYMTSFSEAFHVLEDTYHVTQRLTNVFVRAGLPIFYCSRRLPAEWAIEALQVSPYSYMQWSVNTSNPADYKRLSPGAARLEDIFKYIERMSKLGIYTSFQCNPIHPGITTLDELKELVRIASAAGLRHIIFKFCEQVSNARSIIIDRLRRRNFEPERVAEFDRLFNQVIGGVYTIQEDVRVAWLGELVDTTRQYGITMSTCYEYFDDDKAGENLAPYVTTADQCHGRGIPVHYRPALGEKFRPIPGCYRKGCLYCAEHGTLACRNEELPLAMAWDFADLKRITINHDEMDEADWQLVDSCASPDQARASAARNPNLMTDLEWWDYSESNQ